MDQSRQSEQRGGPRSWESQTEKGMAQSGAAASEKWEHAGPGNRPNGPTEHKQDTVIQAQEQAGKLMGLARDQATSQLATQKVRVADSLGTLATALHDTSRQVRDQDNAAMAGYIDTAAGQLDQLARMLDEQDIEQLLKATERFARRQPALFLGAAFALGFAATRFLRSSSRVTGQEPFGEASNRFTSGSRPSTEQAWQTGTVSTGASGQWAGSSPGGQ